MYIYIYIYIYTYMYDIYNGFFMCLQLCHPHGWTAVYRQVAVFLLYISYI